MWRWSGFTWHVPASACRSRRPLIRPCRARCARPVKADLRPAGFVNPTRESLRNLLAHNELPLEPGHLMFSAGVWYDRFVMAATHSNNRRTIGDRNAARSGAAIGCRANRP